MNKQSSYENYGYKESALNLEITVIVKLNSFYNVDIYCLSYDSTGIYSYLSYPLTRDMIATTDNNSKAMILKLYFDSEPTAKQSQSIVCQAQYKYPSQTTRIIIGDWSVCSDATNTNNNNVTTDQNTSTQVAIEKSYSKIKPYPLFLYFLTDYTNLVDILPDELTLLGEQELTTIFLQSSSLSLSSTLQPKLVDTSKILIVPELSITLSFAQSTLNADISITNVDGIIAIGVTELGVSIDVSEFFVQASSKLVISDLTSIQQNIVVNYRISNLNIGKDYFVNVVGFLYPQAESPNSGIIRKPILASRIKTLDSSILMLIFIFFISLI
ncbi:unnamed protein product (macronuclear) [Paramecium tetraurelia]|uniref:Uncharacterized protein n=1 Tax=Paramecium tetraurelia TaxID=5888 RepID=A0CPF8_PARTE|nr:uncharacterized protein GSPATT00009067001 [Paramecium tetraurelia]CAK72675.1 unnamed protein product [Paramecium tetraurelia]|eukprot:XP_001440072.1 hypothetical protein (macronuclear) [Paramecium tetraurelia strain d4-2]